MARQEYHLENIRKLLINGFDDQELRELCFDVPDFRPVFERLAYNTGKREIVNLLLEYTEKQGLTGMLLELAQEKNPFVYDEFAPYVMSRDSVDKVIGDQQRHKVICWRDSGYKNNLKPSDLSQANLQGLDLSRADLSHVNLSRANLSGAILQEADLRGADLSQAILDFADLRKVKLGNTRIDRKWERICEIFNQPGRNRDLRKKDLSCANLSYADLYGVNLSHANLKETNLSGANLCAANLSDTILNLADLKGVKIDQQTQIADRWRLVWTIVNQSGNNRDLSRAYLYGAKLNGVDLSKSNLRYAILNCTDLSGANLSEADLSGASLYHANLSRAQLIKTNFTNAKVVNANLYEANFVEVKLDGADFAGSNFSETVMDGVVDYTGVRLEKEDTTTRSWLILMGAFITPIIAIVFFWLLGEMIKNFLPDEAEQMEEKVQRWQNMLGEMLTRLREG